MTAMPHKVASEQRVRPTMMSLLAQLTVQNDVWSYQTMAMASFTLQCTKHAYAVRRWCHNLPSQLRIGPLVCPPCNRRPRGRAGHARPAWNQF